MSGEPVTDTGLPKLPEGYFWRVRHWREYIGYGLYNTKKNKLQVQLIHKYTYSRPDYKRVRNWFGRKVYKKYTLTDAVESDVFTEDTLGTNKIAVQNAANRIVKLWEKAKERDALIGDYPPKSL